MASRIVKAASTPALLSLSDEKLKAVQPELFSARSWTRFLRENGYRLGATDQTAAYWKRYIAEYLHAGDPRAAVVLSTAPLLVAAYAGELDCIAMLRFDKKLVRLHGLHAGSRLLAVNTYLEWNFWLPEDLKPGPNDSGKYRNFAPLIADFLCADAGAIQHGKDAVSPFEWTRTETLGHESLNQTGEKARDGRPLLCHLPAKT
jgi:hypothetical protein